MAPYWEPGTQYNNGDVVEYEGHQYKIIQPHRSQSDWTPPITPALWGRLSDQDHNYGGNDHKHHQQHQEGYQPQQPYQQPQQQQQYQPSPQYGQHQSGQQTQQQPNNQVEDDEMKKKMEIGAGLLGGAALLAGGLFAYKEHEKHEGDEQSEEWARNKWLEDARQRKDAFFAQGPQGPCTWVLTHGKEIPQGAILVGREKSWNLYVCRTFHKGGLLIGKASDAFKKGGVIGYKNDEVEVEDFEVLLGDMSGLHWVSASGKLHIATLGHRPVEGGYEKGVPIFVAKAPHHGAEHPGKTAEGWDGAYIPYDGDEKLVKEYQVLCYQ